MKLFADESSLFTRVTDFISTHNIIEKDLKTISDWRHQWKMVFNPDITKQAVEVIFSTKNSKPDHLFLLFNNIPVAGETFTKYKFSKHMKVKITIAMTGIALLKSLSKFVSKDLLNMSYKLNVCLHNQRMYMMNLIEKIQYKVGLVVSGCWQGTSQDKLYNELGWESVSDRHWYRRLYLFYKIINHDTSLIRMGEAW